MNLRMVAFALLAGFGAIGFSPAAISQGKPAQANPAVQLPHYNCFTREVWSTEKQQWCNQQKPFPTEPGVFDNQSGSAQAGDSIPNPPSHLSQQLVNSEWLLEDLGGAGVMDNLQTTLRFGENNRIGGGGGCNRYFARATVVGDRISVSAIGATRRLCAPAVMNQENRYFNALQQARQISLEGPYLLIRVKGLDQPLKFTRL